MVDAKLDPEELKTLQDAPPPKQNKKIEEPPKEDEEDSGYKMLDIAWEAYNSAKAIQSNVGSMVWHGLGLEEPYQAVVSAVEEKASEAWDGLKDGVKNTASAAWDGAKNTASAAWDGASELAYDLRDKLISNSDEYQDGEELDSFSLDDDSDDDDDQYGFSDSDDDYSDNEQYANDSGEIPLTPMSSSPNPGNQDSLSPAPSAKATNALAQQPMPAVPGGAPGAAPGAAPEMSPEVAALAL